MRDHDDVGPLDDLDARILTEMQTLWSRIDPVPAGLADRTKFALTMHSLEAELAELTRGELELTRLDDVARPESVTFTSSRADLLINVAVTSANQARIEGWVTPAGTVVNLHSPAGDLTTTSDETGRFVFTAVTRGQVRFTLWPEGDQEGRPVVTPAIEV